MIPTSRIRHPLQRGYSLIEMAVVLAIIGTVTGSALVLGKAHDESSKAKTTKQRLDTIEEAIQAHSYAGGYLPCPAIPVALENTATFGVSHDCSLAAPTDATILQVGAGTNEEIWIGGVPTRSLNLSDEYMVDGWNNRFSYAVVKNLAIDASTFDAFSASSGTSVIEITDAAGIQIPDPDTVVAYAVISHGKDGKGARNRLGALTACATTGLDKENCDATDTFMDSRIADSVTAANYYDDMIRWKQMNFMQPPVVADGSGGEEDSPTAFGTGDWHACAVKSDATVWCWGRNTFGQLGDGTTTTRLTPVQVPGLTGVTQLAVGRSQNHVQKADGTVWAWGRNNLALWGHPGRGGSIGDGTIVQRNSPVQIALTNVETLHGSDVHTCAVKTDGTVWCWGINNDAWGNGAGGMLGTGACCADAHSPTQVTGGFTATKMGLGYLNSCAIKADGTAWCWGADQFGGNPFNGQLGDGGTNTDKYSPVQVSGLTGASQISPGDFHTCALKTDSTVWCWGTNNLAYGVHSGMVGDGTTTNRSTPVQIPSFTGVSQISGGNWHHCALKTDGTVWCWGSNSFGQLGDGTMTNRLSPVQVPGLTGVASVQSGEEFTCAGKSDGTIWCWGENANGQLGNGTTTDSLTPVQVLNFP